MAQARQLFCGKTWQRVEGGETNRRPGLQITFPAPVVVTAARCGAVPSSAAGHQQTLLLLFAQDAGAPASARFLQLCPGFEQPQSGTRVVQLQVGSR